MPFECESVLFARVPLPTYPPAYVRVVHVHAQRNLTRAEYVHHGEEQSPAAYRRHFAAAA